MEKIAIGEALHEFPSKYFPPEQTELILGDLRDKCDFKNRSGRFINDFFKENVGDTDQIYLLYEYYLKCDSIRLILIYNLDKEIVLSGFRLEPIEKDNSMIVRKNQRLLRE